LSPALTATWSADWAWSLPLLVGIVVAHAAGLGLISQQATHILGHGNKRRWHIFPMFVGVVGTTALLVTCLHALEAAVWALAYRKLNALPNTHTAILYSLSALTSYGHETFDLAPHWQLMGAIEALNGWIVFGLSTAFMFQIVQRIWQQAIE
jgi:hypothetical protein